MLGTGLSLLPLLYCFQAARGIGAKPEEATPQKGIIRCCEESSNSHCRWYCRVLLKDPPSLETQGQVLAKLIAAGCGAPLPSERLWQCFLRASHIRLLNQQRDQQGNPMQVDSQLQLPEHSGGLLAPIESMHMEKDVFALPLDLAKSHCCNRARTLECHELCLKTFGRQWETTWMLFDQRCQYNPEEQQLLLCLEQVGEPCELGCDGLDFCKSFNRRPLELFGSCNNQADTAAKKDASLLLNPNIEEEDIFFPDPIGRFLKPNNTFSCSQELLATVACMLQIKPCHVTNHYRGICRSDCFHLLSTCVKGGVDQDICGAVSAPLGDPCVPLDSFLVHNKEQETDISGETELHHPCRSHPCPSNYICQVLGNGYFCSPGCRLGEMSSNVVQKDTWLLVPQPTSSAAGCQIACRCSNRHLSATTCNDSGYSCGAVSGCYWRSRTNNTQRYVHRSYFNMGCNSCLCFDGEITCWERQCDEDTPSSALDTTDTHCSCPGHYVPVCGVNGKTYPSACNARCENLLETQYESGSCYSINSCYRNPCPPKKRCIPERNICLTWDATGCPQYRCVDLKNCNDLPFSPVCSSTGQQFDNICHLINNNQTLAYHGLCQIGCHSRDTVCGVNGEDYASECAAWADYTVVDYDGPCTAYPVSGKLECVYVKCKPLPSKFCKPIHLPGNCCPVCGGGTLSLAYSSRIFNHYLKGSVGSSDAATVKTLASQLAQRISLSECRLSAHINGRRTRVIVLLTVSTPQPTALQVRACEMEALKLRTLVEQQSPVIFLQLPMAAITGVDYDATQPADGSATVQLSVSLILVTLIISWRLRGCL